MSRRAPALSTLIVCAAPVLAGCGNDLLTIEGTPEGGELVCDLDLTFLADGGVGRDGIPALSDPEFVPVEPLVLENTYLRPDDRIIALQEGGEWLAIPHNVMWRHEIVNLPEVTVTYCPLTGSALAFARLSVSGAEFGVSGLLYNANLILYDRNEPDESLWPQMLGEARCGPRAGQKLQRVPVVEMTWEAWRALHPESKVVALPTVFDRGLYMLNPYGLDYEDPDNSDYLGYPIPQSDRRLLPKERVLGIPDHEDGPLAYAFDVMQSHGDYGVFPFDYNGEPSVVFWDGRAISSMAYRTTVNSQQATFAAVDGGFLDSVSGTVWAVDGTPVSGPLAGTSRRLRPITSVYVAFWDAWAAFHPGTELGVEP